MVVRTADFDYELPPELIAQAPLPERDASRKALLEDLPAFHFQLTSKTAQP